MTVVGIVVEYNPFHNGHLYQVKKIREKFPHSYIAVIMSGCWTQRGEPALFNKWIRTKMALDNGVDLVLELPVVYAVQSAEGFARGAVSSLEGTNVVDYLCFGSEAGNLETLQSMADKLLQESAAFKSNLKTYLKKGYSYPKAFSLTLEENKNEQQIEKQEKQLLQPNNILGIEYLKALAVINSKIKPINIKRYKVGYNDPEFKGSLAGATAIRKTLYNGKMKEIAKVVPEPTWNLMAQANNSGMGPVFYDEFAPLILGLLRRSKPDELKTLPGLEKGLHSLLYKSRNKPDLKSLLDSLKSKRYTLSRIQRILVHFLLGLSREKMNDYNAYGPQYLRLLGFSFRGEELLSTIKSKGKLPIITRPTPYLKSPEASYLGKNMLREDLLASDLYCLGQQSKRQGALDYTNTVIKGGNKCY